MNFALYADGMPLVPCPTTLAEAAESARSGARSRPGVKYEVRRGDVVLARYVLRGGKLDRWVR